MPRLRASFYTRPDVVALSRELLGAYLFTRLPGPDGTDALTGGRITETEAYAGPEDRASHAYANRRTRRTEVMYRSGGVAYVYLCYGMHHLFNIVTNRRGTPHAILVRAIEPTDGIDTMLARRRKQRIDKTLTCGPACVTQALGIDLALNGADLTGDRVWMEARDAPPHPRLVNAAPRVGVDYAGAHAARPWRFMLKDTPWVSKR